MALETGSYISDLVATNPPFTDDVGQADDHIRLIKSTLKNTFPNINGAMQVKEEILNVLAVDITPPPGDGYVLAYDLATVSIKWVTPADGGGGVPAHTHNASDITAGTLAVARLPVGTGAGTVAAGNHTHTTIANALLVTGEITTGATGQAAVGYAAGTSTAYLAARVASADTAMLTWTGSAAYAPVLADGATHGAVLSHAGAIKLVTAATGIVVYGGIAPDTDNAYSLGQGFGGRWTAVYAVNGTIQTSDARAKRGVRPLTDLEVEASRRIAKLVRAFQWQDMASDHRVHVGVVAQDVIACMKQLNLSAENYGFIDMTGERYGINYGELAMFIAAGHEQRLDAIERRYGD